MQHLGSRLAIGLLVIGLSGSQQLVDVACETADKRQSCNSLLVSAPNWGDWLSGRDTRVSTHFLDLLELLTRNAGNRGGKH
ncbi:MAG: hypothetical protein KA754_09415 [Corallincola sp.]|nr:hypothetical protein [Corallincola sp.]